MVNALPFTILANLLFVGVQCNDVLFEKLKSGARNVFGLIVRSPSEEVEIFKYKHVLGPNNQVFRNIKRSSEVRIQ